MIAQLLLVAQAVLLAYFAVIQTIQLVVGWRGIQTIWRSSRERSMLTLSDLVEQGAYQPISILVPAYNEERTICESIVSLLQIDFPEFEIIVVSDGSTDETVKRLTRAFGLEPIRHLYAHRLETRPIRRILGSKAHPNLLVVEKENGGKGDALNAGLNIARYPLVCTIDADSMIAGDALLRAARIFTNDEAVVAVGGAIRPLNGATFSKGAIQSLELPKRWIERFQIVEYARSFFASRVGWGSWNALLLISGAFGVFRRESLLAIGGYRTDTVGEDLELVVRLHAHHREARIPYRILSIPEPMCWTQVPSDLRSLIRQRNRWQRGLWETLLAHRRMALRPSLGRQGLLAIPYLWLFEGLAPAVELLGYLILPIAYFAGVLNLEFALLFLVLALGFGLLSSLMGLGAERMQEPRYARLRDRILLMLASVLEMVGYRQILIVERMLAFFQVWSRRGQWGAIERQQIRAPGDPAFAKLPARDR